MVPPRRAGEAILELEATAHPWFLELNIRGIAGDLEQHLVIDAGNGSSPVPLVAGWNTVSAPLPAGCATVRLATDRLLSAEARAGDDRTLALRLKDPRLHDDADRHTLACRRHDARLTAARTIADSLLGAYRRTASALRLLSGFRGIEEDEGTEPRLPICTEPWTSLYVLRRGTLPCCYGGPVLAPMASFQEAWNAPLVQDIRRELRDGRFHAYCFDSPDCPIVRKASESGALPAAQSALLVARRGLSRLRRAGSALLNPSVRSR